MLLCLIWLAVMSAMVVLAPIGKHALFFSMMYCAGHALMILMVRQFPTEFSPNKVLAAIFALGIIARFLYLFYPVGNDVYRYVWEGHIQNLGFNPFKFSPLSPALSEIARGNLYNIWQQINHPDFTAVYPPAALLVFRMLAWIEPDPYFFKMAIAVFDIGVLVILALMIKHCGMPPSRLLLYATNPLVVLYICGEGHLDGIQLFFLCLALYLILCKKFYTSGFLFLGVAILSKYFALVALPFLITAENRTKSLAVLIPLILYIPYIDAGSGVFRSLGEFGFQFHFNDSVSELIRYIFGSHYLLISIGLLGTCLAWTYLFVHHELRSVYLAIGCLLVFLPTLHPWYIVLISPFLVFYPSWAWLYLQIAVVFTFPVYAIEFNTGIFQEIAWLKLLEYIPFYGLLLYGILKGGFLVNNQTYSKPGCISVVIPTLNESKRLVGCLESLRNRTALTEVIVSDGGSQDDTPAIAERLGARLVKSPKGRGLQIRKGIQSASGDVIVILHADCTAAQGVFRRILKTLEADCHAVGGAVGMRFENENIKTMVISSLNNLRAFLTGISFGDQAQFFRADVLTVCGGFPSMMLMEDVELSLRLKEFGRLVFLRKGIIVSGRRWTNVGFIGSLLTVAHLFPRYLIERRFWRSNSLKQNFYEIYYSD
jgi:rSAM/selenodomain-associated transferase 2